MYYCLVHKKNEYYFVSITPLTSTHLCHHANACSVGNAVCNASKTTLALLPDTAINDNLSYHLQKIHFNAVATEVG